LFNHFSLLFSSHHRPGEQVNSTTILTCIFFGHLCGLFALGLVLVIVLLQYYLHFLYFLLTIVKLFFFLRLLLLPHSTSFTWYIFQLIHIIVVVGREKERTERESDWICFPYYTRKTCTYLRTYVQLIIVFLYCSKVKVAEILVGSSWYPICICVANREKSFLI